MTAQPAYSSALAHQSDPPPYQVLRGPAFLRLVRDGISGLVAQACPPVTARPAWLMATLTARPDLQPWGVTVQDASGRVSAAVLLADELDRSGHVRTVLLGSDLVHRGAVLAAHPAAARELGTALQAALLATPHLADLRLGPLAADCPLVAAFAEGLEFVVPVDVDPIPVVTPPASCVDALDLLSPSVRRTLRKATNRLRADGIVPRTEVVTDRAAVLGWLPRLAEQHRERDHAHGRSSALDEGVGADLWSGRIEALLGEGLELSLLFLGDDLAAYVLGVPDGATYRLLDGRFASRWNRYAPGRQLETAVLQRVVDDPRLDALDWMTGIAPETLLVATGTTPMVELRLRSL